VVLLIDALRTLAPAHRRALTLHYLLDRSVGQIAAEIGVSENTVKSWLSRGRAALAQYLCPRLDDHRRRSSRADHHDGRRSSPAHDYHSAANGTTPVGESDAH
jgi:hypothetical protein